MLGFEPCAFGFFLSLLSCFVGDVMGLGILEVAPEDFALLDYVNSSKIDTQELIRKGLDIMQVEIG